MSNDARLALADEIEACGRLYCCTVIQGQSGYQLGIKKTAELASYLSRASYPGTVSREAVARIIDPEAYAADERFSSPGTRQRVGEAEKKANTILSLSIPTIGREALEAIIAIAPKRRGDNKCHCTVCEMRDIAEASLSALPVKDQ